LTPLHQIATGDSENILWRFGDHEEKPESAPLLGSSRQRPEKNRLKFTRRLDESPPL
jgi:hypothetical protein